LQENREKEVSSTLVLLECLSILVNINNVNNDEDSFTNTALPSAGSALPAQTINSSCSYCGGKAKGEELQFSPSDNQALSMNDSPNSAIMMNMIMMITTTTIPALPYPSPSSQSRGISDPRLNEHMNEDMTMYCQIIR
jgi:hypothetical protein